MSVIISNIKVEFHLDPPVVTFLQGCDMNIENIRNVLRQIEADDEARLFDSFTPGQGMIVRADGNYPFQTETTSMDVTILPPFVIKFEAGPIAFSTDRGSLLGEFIESPGAIIQINNAKGAFKIDWGVISDADKDDIINGVAALDVIRKILYRAR